jgi:signal transduction histidine kinase
MAAEHRRLGSLVAHLPDGVILLDSEDRLVLANQMARQLLQSWSWREGDDKLTHLAGQPLAKFLTANVSGLPYEVELVAPVPRVFEIMVKAMGVGPEAGGWMLVIRDVTEERVTRERIRQQEQMAAIGQLAAGIAHDFNNILTSIIGFSELLLVEPDIPPPANQDLERITKQGRRAAHLVSQILDFSRQSGIEKRPVNLVVFLQVTLKLLERTISEAIQISLEIETTAHSYLLEADITQLQQAITNLAINARDAMPGGGQLRFRLRTLTLGPHDRRPTPDISMGTWLVLAVADTGLGIPPQIMPRIFEPFFTTKEVGQGTGLGLAQVYGIVKQHGGDIEVRSQTGQGTTFTLYLPAALTQNYSLPLAPPEATNIPYGQGELILLVEDDGAVLEAAQAMLERLRYRVLTASDGQAALKIYEHYQESIDLVLADLTMPNMGGLDLSIALRARNPALKILTMTGYPSPGETQELLSQGFTERLRKPLSIERLARMVHHLLYP